MHAMGKEARGPLGPYGVWLEERGLFASLRGRLRGSAWRRSVARYLRQPGEPASGRDEAVRRLGAPRRRVRRRVARPADRVSGCERCPTVVPGTSTSASSGPTTRSTLPPTTPIGSATLRCSGRRCSTTASGRPSAMTAREYGNTAARTVRRLAASSRLRSAAIDDQVGEILATLDELRTVGRHRGGLQLPTTVRCSATTACSRSRFPYEPAMRIPLIVGRAGYQRGVSATALTELIDVWHRPCSSWPVWHVPPDLDRRPFVHVTQLVSPDIATSRCPRGRAEPLPGDPDSRPTSTSTTWIRSTTATSSTTWRGRPRRDREPDRRRAQSRRRTADRPDSTAISGRGGDGCPDGP